MPDTAVPALLKPAAPDGRDVPNVVSSWLMQLHALCAGTTTAAEAEARVALVAPMIASRFPIEAFTRRTLEYVAHLTRFWPAYGELAERLGDAWVKHRPPAFRLEAPRREETFGPEPGSPEHDRIVAGFAALRQEMAANIVAREAADRLKLPQPRDVTAKGEVLAQMRAARGIA